MPKACPQEPTTCAQAECGCSGLPRPLCAQHFAWRFACPSPECMRKRADFTITQQPCDFRNAHIAFYEIAACEVGSQGFQQLGERESFRRQAARKRSLAQSELPRNVSRCCLSVRKQWRDRIFNGGLKRAPLYFPMSKSVFAIRNQQVVEVRVSADDVGVPHARWKYNVVDRGA